MNVENIENIKREVEEARGRLPPIAIGAGVYAGARVRRAARGGGEFFYPVAPDMVTDWAALVEERAEAEERAAAERAAAAEERAAAPVAAAAVAPAARPRFEQPRAVGRDAARKNRRAADRLEALRAGRMTVTRFNALQRQAGMPEVDPRAGFEVAAVEPRPIDPAAGFVQPRAVGRDAARKDRRAADRLEALRAGRMTVARFNALQRQAGMPEVVPGVVAVGRDLAAAVVQPARDPAAGFVQPRAVGRDAARKNRRAADRLEALRAGRMTVTRFNALQRQAGMPEVVPEVAVPEAAVPEVAPEVVPEAAPEVVPEAVNSDEVRRLTLAAAAGGLYASAVADILRARGGGLPLVVGITFPLRAAPGLIVARRAVSFAPVAEMLTAAGERALGVELGARIYQLCAPAGGQQLASDYADAVEGTYPELPRRGQLFEFARVYIGPEQAAGGGGHSSASITKLGGGLVLSSLRGPEGYCLAVAFVGSTGFDFRADGRGATVKTWARSLLGPPTAEGYTVEHLKTLERHAMRSVHAYEVVGEAGAERLVTLYAGTKRRGCYAAEPIALYRGHWYNVPGGKIPRAAAVDVVPRGQPAAGESGENGRVVIAYDFETVPDQFGNSHPYAVTAFAYREDDPAELNNVPSTLEGWRKAVAEGRALYAVSADPEGNGVAQALLTFVQRVREGAGGGSGCILSSFNGSRFDDLITFRAADAAGLLGGRGFLARGTEILRAVMAGAATHDVARFSAGSSLAGMCAAYRIKRAKVANGIDHDAAAEAYAATASGVDPSRFSAWLGANAGALEEYAAFDTLALVELGYVLRKELAQLAQDTAGIAIDWRDYITSASFAFDVLIRVQNRAGVSMPAAATSVAVDKWFRKSLTAGRTQNLAGRPVDVVGSYEMFDITSSYPNVMSREAFPVGMYQETAQEVPGCLGIYNIHIVRQPPINVLPFRSPEPGVPLDWDYRGAFDAVATSIDIEEIRKHGGEVIVGCGVYWPESSRDLFAGYVSSLYRLKAAEDAAPKSERNDARRSCIKLLLNGVSGKVAQKQHTSLAVVAKGRADVEKTLHELDPDTLTIEPLSRGVYISGRYTAENIAARWEEAVKNRKARPSPLASFIYSYARRNLYEGLLRGSLYCDTDSCLLPWAAAKQWREERPDLFAKAGQPKQLGEWEGELGQDGGKIFRVQIVRPKVYAITSLNGDSSHDKARVKGVSRRAIVVPDEVATRLRGSPNEDDRKRYVAAYISERAEAYKIARASPERDLAGIEEEHGEPCLANAGTVRRVFASWVTGVPVTFVDVQTRRAVGYAGGYARELTGGAVAGVSFRLIVKTLTP